MTERKDLLRPAEPARRLAPADRETLAALQTAVGECASLIASQGTAAQQAAARQQEQLQACVDALHRFGERLDRHDDDGASRHAALTEAAGRIQAAIAGLPKGPGAARSADEAGMRADLAGMSATLERVAATQELHGLELLAMARAFEALGIALVAWRDETQGAGAREAHPGQSGSLGDLARGTATLAARVGQFEALLARCQPSPWLLVAIPLLLAFVYGAGLMTDVMIRFIDGSAGQSVPLVTELLPWPLPDSGPETATAE